MKKYAIALLPAFFLFIFLGTANAVMYDFDSLNDGAYSESDFSEFFDGISFQNTGGDYFNVTKDGNQDSNINNSFDGALLKDERWVPANSTIATFDYLTDYVSITHETDVIWTVAFIMRVYDNNDNLLTEVKQWHTSWNEYEPAMNSYTLDYKSDIANIAYIEFWNTDANYTDNADGYWDNLGFNLSDPQPVSKPQPNPEPGTMLLFATGIFGFVVRSIWLKKA